MSLHRFVEVSPAQPCGSCEGTSWCTRAPSSGYAICRRVRREGAREKKDRNGSPYWVFREDGRPFQKRDVPTLAPEAPRAPDEVLDLVYRGILSALRLEDRHRESLNRRGLSNEEIDRLGYRSAPRAERIEIARELIEKFGEDRCAQVPGIIQKSGDGDARYWTLAGGSGIVIPVRNENGHVVALKLRSDNDDGPRYYYLSSSRHGGPSPGSPLHFPLGADFESAEIIRGTEGELKADIATYLSGVPTLSVPGVSHLSRISGLRTVRTAKPRGFQLAIDNDFRENVHVAVALVDFLGKALNDQTIRLGLELWDNPQAKGIDDLLCSMGESHVVYGADALRIAQEALARLRGPGLDDRIRSFVRFPNEPWPEVRARLATLELFTEIAGDPSAITYRAKLLHQTLGKDIAKRDINRAIRDAQEELDDLDDDDSQSTPGANTTQMLISIGSEAELVHDERGEPFAIFEIDGIRRVIWRMMRVVILNGIGWYVTETDLLDRSLVFENARLADCRRISKNELENRFQAALPGILGALFDLVSAVLKLRPKVQPPGDYRMIDFVATGMAVEQAMGWPEGSFLAAMEWQRTFKAENAIENSAVGSAVLEFASKLPEPWSGTATDLKRLLDRMLGAGASELPKAIGQFGRELRTVEPHLATLGILIHRETVGHAKKRMLTVSQKGSKLLSALSAEARTEQIDEDDPALRELLGEDAGDTEESR